MELAEFLAARVADDEEAAQAAVRWSEGATEWADAGEPDWQHIARWDPARVLAECEAKRRIVEQLAPIAEETWDVDLGRVLKLLALPYADHPDYRQEWRP